MAFPVLSDLLPIEEYKEEHQEEALQQVQNHVYEMELERPYSSHRKRQICFSGRGLCDRQMRRHGRYRECDRLENGTGRHRLFPAECGV